LIVVEGSEGQDAGLAESTGLSMKHGDRRRGRERHVERASGVFGWEDSCEAKCVLNLKG
jgi:hypothetical protein